jgi:hypothetical protein
VIAAPGVDFVAAGSVSSNRAAFEFDAGFELVGALLAAPAFDVTVEIVAAAFF